MDTKKTVGWLLVILGVMIVLGGLYYGFLVFVKGSPPPPIFKAPLSDNTPKGILGERTAQGSNIQQKIQQQMQETIINEFQKRLPTDFLPKIFNLTALAAFVGIAIAGGGKLSLIGIRLLK